MQFKILELTKENKEKYLDKIANLEQKVLEDMESKGKKGQLFITGKEDIEKYVDSEENSVIIAINSNQEVIAGVYITQNQKPFTYNDITKYFKYGDDYKEYVKSLYENRPNEYKRDILEAYKIKMEAYKYASDEILNKHPEYATIHEFLEHELNDDKNRFHEKSELRESINEYMSKYIEDNYPEKMQLYERFYWTTIEDIQKEFDKNIDLQNIKNENVRNYEEFINSEYAKEHSEILEKGKLKIYERPEFDVKEYYSANTNNSVEIDTYIADPETRQLGLARILAFEGIKKHIERHFENENNKEIFLCSTLHRDNVSSKYVSEFFGLKDKLFVNRRYGRDREVHICKIQRENAKEYLDNMSRKMAVLYGYNPHNINITSEQKIDVLQEQIEYEEDEVKRLNGIKKQEGKKYYNGNIDVVTSKTEKIEKLKGKLKEEQNKINNKNEGQCLEEK